MLKADVDLWCKANNLKAILFWRYPLRISTKLSSSMSAVFHEFSRCPQARDGIES